MIEKGDKCHVRLKSGEIVEAEYDKKLNFPRKFHDVKVGDEEMIACSWGGDLLESWECRFVCMTGLNKGER